MGDFSINTIVNLNETEKTQSGFSSSYKKSHCDPSVQTAFTSLGYAVGTDWETDRNPQPEIMCPKTGTSFPFPFGKLETII